MLPAAVYGPLQCPPRSVMQLSLIYLLRLPILLVSVLFPHFFATARISTSAAAFFPSVPHGEPTAANSFVLEVKELLEMKANNENKPYVHLNPCNPLPRARSCSCRAANPC